MSAYPQEEFEPEFDEVPAEEFEFSGDGQGEDSFEQEGSFDETEEMELAAELLAVNDEGELDQFLGKLLRKAGRAVGGGLNSPLGRTLGGFLKGAVKKALPTLGGIAGNFLMPGIGGAIGSRLASTAGGMFGLELEGLSSEDQEFEVARHLVRFAGNAASNAARLAGTQGGLAGNVAQMAQQALRTAARRHAPGLSGNLSRRNRPFAAGNCHCGSPSSGRWIRRRGKVYLLGV
jgi:hypothetical protein